MRSITCTSALTSKCQTTIPKGVRDHLHIGPGDRVKWFTLPDGRVLLLPLSPITSLRGIIKAPKQKIGEDQMEQGIAEGASERYERYLDQK